MRGAYFMRAERNLDFVMSYTRVQWLKPAAYDKDRFVYAIEITGLKLTALLKSTLLLHLTDLDVVQTLQFRNPVYQFTVRLSAYLNILSRG